MSDTEYKGQLPQLPQEQTGKCPVCGEQYIRYEATAGGICKEETVPFCFAGINGVKTVGVYYHA